MPKVKLTLEYDGAAFSGWQLQPGRATVQGELQRALEIALREPISHVQGAGRTDAGVHARGQVAHFVCQGNPDLLRLRLAVSSILRGKLSVLDASIVPDSFHALRDVISKWYRYRVLNRPIPEIFERGIVWRYGVPLNAELMHQAAQALVGEHDFSAFRSADCDSEDVIKRIHSISVSRIGSDDIVIDVVGKGFLRNMVRIIAGTLVEVGAGARNCSLHDVLNSRDRLRAGVTAPAHGLTIMAVSYAGVLTPRAYM